MAKNRSRNKENGVFNEPELADWGVHGSESPLNTIHQLELKISLIQGRKNTSDTPVR
jgi:hypothetical protein